MRKAPRTIQDLLADPRPIAGADPIVDLLAQLSDATQRAAMSDEDLASAEEQLVAHAESLASEDTDEALETLAEIHSGVTTLRTEAQERETAAQERAQRREQLMSQINPPEGEGDGDGGDSGDGTGEGDGDGGTSDDSEGDGDGSEGDDGDGESGTEGDGDGAGDGEGSGDGDGTTQTAATPPPRRIRPGNLNRNRRPEQAPQATSTADRRGTIVASAGTPGVAADTTYDSLVAAAQAFIDRQRSFMGRGNDEKVPVISLQAEYPEDRRVLSTNSQEQNGAIVASIIGAPAIVASVEAGEMARVAAGGFCAPSAVRYELEGISVADRPVRDSLAQFQADRGGIRFPEPTSFADMAGAVSIWTEQNDIDAVDNENLRKACLRVECGEFEEERIEAVVACLTFGNLGARAWPENVAQRLRDLMAIHARLGERRLLAKMATNSTAVTAGQQLGAARDILFHIGVAAAAYRNRHRTRRDFPLSVILPVWVRDLIREDIARQIPGDNSLRTAQAEIDGYFADRFVNVTWALDGNGDQEFGPQTAGELLGFPGQVRGLLFHPGAHVFLDGGNLDLGLVRDSTLNARNDYQMFSETFENVAFTGLESIDFTFDVCPNGATASTEQADCTAGASAGS